MISLVLMVIYEAKTLVCLVLFCFEWGVRSLSVTCSPTHTFNIVFLHFFVCKNLFQD